MRSTRISSRISTRISTRSPARAFAALTFAAPLVVVASCSVAELDLTGKQCPCTSGYVCDVPSNTCVFALTRPDGGPLDDALVAPERNPAALLSVKSFAVVADWKTPNVVRWDFTIEGKAPDFKSYRLDVGARMTSFADNDFVSYGPIDRPELGVFDARGAKVAGPASLWTFSRANPNTKQFGRLTVVDRTNQQNVSVIASAQAASGASSKAALFDGITPATTPRPTGMFDFKNGAHVFNVDCATLPSPCVKKVELGGLAVALDASGPFTQADFDRAFLDLELEGTFAASSFDSVVAIEPGTGACTGGDCRWGYAGWTMSAAPNPGVTTLQVPLAKLNSAARGALTRPILEEKGFKVAVLAISGTWRDKANLRLLSAYIRW